MPTIRSRYFAQDKSQPQDKSLPKSLSPRTSTSASPSTKRQKTTLELTSAVNPLSSDPDELPDFEDLLCRFRKPGKSGVPSLQAISSVTSPVFNTSQAQLPTASPHVEGRVGEDCAKTLENLQVGTETSLVGIQPADHESGQIDPVRLPTGLRLARFLNFSRAESSTLSQKDLQTNQNDPTRPSEHQMTFRKKKAKQQYMPSAVRWEQPKSIWDVGFEGCQSTFPPKGQTYGPDGELHSEEDLANNGPAKDNIEASKRDAKKKRTKLEEQWSEFKALYPDLMLLMEVGYKIRLFGKDAILASQILSIGHLAIPGHETAFFPKANLRIHLERLVRAGHKVGLISQSETKSIKSGPQKLLFKRHLSQIYSLATWTENEQDLPPSFQREGPSENHIHQTWIMSFYEDIASSKGSKALSGKVQLSMVALCPQSGEIVWDSWTDDRMRSRMESLMLYFNPLEIIIPLNGLSLRSEKLITWIINNETAASSAKARLESTDRDFDVREAYQFVTKFCHPIRKSTKGSNVEQSNSSNNNRNNSVDVQLLQHIIELPDDVLIPLAGLISHVKAYQLESVFRQPGSFKSFSSLSHMLLDANTLRNLEIFHNSTDGSEKGSLLWILDRTSTPMGKRLLRQWIGRPLTDIKMLRERAEAVHEITINQNHQVVLKANRLLNHRPSDLEKSLVRIQYGKCTAKELIKFLDVMASLASTFRPSPPGKKFFVSNFLNELFSGFEKIKELVCQYSSELNSSSIMRGELKDMFIHAEEKYPEITELNDCISCVEAELNEHLVSCRVLIQNPKLTYLTIGGEDLLLEVRTQHLSSVPQTWTKVSSTRAVHRFRTPEAQRLKEERDKYCDLLEQTVHQCFLGFLRSMEEDFDAFRSVINKVALIDCLMSLAAGGIQYNYCKPTLLDHPFVHLRRARHPIVEQLTHDPLVDNDVHLSRGQRSTMILTGNNMGGKSVTSKMIACIILLAQVGCYVPAERATIGIFDSCYTRMGMSEEVRRGRSAFMVEMCETSNILKAATPRSLVIFDELGYGTSTYDGLAVATAVLHDLISRVGCFTVFITHYPQLHELALKYSKTVQSFHMKFLETVRSDGTPDITFLYKLAPGLAIKSHGIHVARLAGLPESVLKTSQEQSNRLEAKVNAQQQAQRFKRIEKLLRCLSNPNSDTPASILQQAHIIHGATMRLQAT